MEQVALRCRAPTLPTRASVRTSTWSPESHAGRSPSRSRVQSRPRWRRQHRPHL